MVTYPLVIFSLYFDVYYLLGYGNTGFTTSAILFLSRDELLFVIFIVLIVLTFYTIYAYNDNINI